MTLSFSNVLTLIYGSFGLAVCLIHMIEAYHNDRLYAELEQRARQKLHIVSPYNSRRQEMLCQSQPTTVAASASASE